MTVSAKGYDLTALSKSEVDEKAAGLSAEEKRVLLDHGTEHPFCGTLLDNKKPGFTCAGCVICRCSAPMPNLIPVPVGPAFFSRSIPSTSATFRTTAWA